MVVISWADFTEILNFQAFLTDKVSEEYGYEVNDTDESFIVTPIILRGEKLPDYFPIPSTCGKCARDISCPCCTKEII